MSLSKEKRESIKKYILEKAAEGETDIIQKVTDTFGVSRQSAYKYVRDLQSTGSIRKVGKNYRIVSQFHSFEIDLTDQKNRDEDVIYREKVFPVLQNLPTNVIGMWSFCFSEMMNNAIDHSEADACRVKLIQNPVYTAVIIADDGVGIFKKIKEHYGFQSLDDAIVELFKGKLTTDRLHHSGEGIFFSSRIMDVFAAISDGKVFSHTDFEETIEDLSDTNVWLDKGTVIYMRLSNHSQKTNRDIMQIYADVDGGFTKTEIPIRHLFDGYPVSRSQAKRLYNRFEDFQEVELDFSGVEEIGQGFAHELFVVYVKAHPEVMLLMVNTNENIQRMIYHVTH